MREREKIIRANRILVGMRSARIGRDLSFTDARESLLVPE